jgi:hypothetical protein
MHVYRSRRFSRAARRFGETLERSLQELGDDLEAMGDELGDDMSDYGDSASGGSYEDWRTRRRARKAARRQARRERREERRERQAEAYAAWREDQAERREAWRERRRARRARACGWGSMWWLIFPIIFAGGPLLEVVSELWSGALAGVGAVMTGVMNFTIAGPIAQLMSSSMSISFTDAFALLGLAAAVAGAAAWLGIRLSAPQPAR